MLLYRPKPRTDNTRAEGLIRFGENFKEFRMRVLFLDFDGVLNHRGCSAEHEVPGLPPFMRIDRDCLNRLNSITEEFRPTIVVSSTWRLGIPLTELQIALTGIGLASFITDYTPVTHGLRGEEIQRWMHQNGASVNDVVILDDDDDMLHLMSRLVRTSPSEGLQDHHIDEVRRLWS